MDIDRLAGIGPGRAKILREMGISTLSDLLYHFPRDHDDRSEIKTIGMLVPGITQTIRGIISAEAENINFRPGTPVMTKLLLRDETGELTLVWFGQPYLKQNFKKHEEYIFTGRVAEAYGAAVGRLQMESPDYEKPENMPAGRIVPIYSLPKGISQKMFRKWMKAALDISNEDKAISSIHFPESAEDFHAARRKLVFEELFFMQLSLLRIKGAAPPGIVIEEVDIGPFEATLPYSLTEAQQKVLRDICSDLQSGRRMNRLVQGDVGSGKTVVAAALAYLAVKAGWQLAVMAPTEVLARQHYKSFVKFLGAEKIALLSGTMPAKEKAKTQAAIRDGVVHVVIGTHALIQEGVEFHKLGFVVTDEQHRFGVKQRAALSDKGFSSSTQILPHIMLMTATPIPRTLGLILYGDMDISVIDELPPGRQEIKTYCVNSSYRRRLINFMAKQVKEGRQVYVICPAIDESESETSPGEMQSVTAYAEKLQAALPAIPIACLHGRMKDKEAVMAAFERGDYPIIVSTTVVEVGVDVPNATLIVIENAERFGLAQLHQLRGRVGRGAHQSYCVLVTDSRAEHSLERMRAMEGSGDGFVLSELDLKMRGPGDFFGVQQSGLPVFRIANLYRDMEILKEAQQAAAEYHESGKEPKKALLEWIPL